MRTDFETKQDVLAELQWEPALNVNELAVSVEQGIVVLSGMVPSYYEKMLAEKCAKRIIGVKVVVQNISVKNSVGKIKSDMELAEAILDALKWDGRIGHDKIKIKVEQGMVIAEGSVKWNFEKEAVSSLIEKLRGVNGLINNLHVKNKIESKKIKHDIAGAFVRNAAIDAKGIKIVASGDRVILRGKVRSWAEKMDAERIAWNTLGVMEVDNELEVESSVMVY